MVQTQLIVCFVMIFIRGAFQHALVEMQSINKNNASQELEYDSEEMNREYRPIIPPAPTDLIPDNYPLAAGPPGKMGPRGMRGPRGEPGVQGPKVSLSCFSIFL